MRLTIFLTSVEHWGDNWYSKQHYAAQLVAMGHDVYFVNGPTKWKPSNLFSFKVRQRTTPEGVRVLDYRNNLPLQGLPKLALRINDWLNSRKLRKLARTQHPGQQGVIWCFDPTRFIYTGPLRKAGFRHIYHVVDPYQMFYTDKLLASRAHLLVAIHGWFFRYYERYNAHRILIPHGIRPIDRTHDPVQVQELQAKWGPYLLLASSLAHQFFNFDLLYKVAKHFSNYRILIVGNKGNLSAEREQAFQRVLALPNVTYDGVKHPDVLRNIVAGAQACLATYNFTARESEPSVPFGPPLKALTYLTQHRPTVSSINSYIPPFDDNGYYKADDVAQFITLLTDVLEGRLGVNVDTVDAYLDTVEYQSLIHQILTALDKATDR